ncbi:TRAP transporter small permease [Clostridium transplantifaecale]|uniref:TRAP transporter small permease n=1 Tax=Clostridium transplantifaecale TaxID=2479838 RepID=UPI000F63BE13|nr:TRAP transporter small permease [Clostridium transplantifaecale]
MKKFWKWFDENFEECLLMILLILMTAVMFAQIIMRFVYRESMSWPEEFCRFSFVISGFLSIGYCIRKNKMLKVDILVGFFPDSVKKVFDLAGRIVTLIFFTYFSYYGYFAMMNSVRGGMKSPAMEVPMYVLYGSVFIGSVIGVIRQIQDLVKWFWKKDRKDNKEVAE